MIVKLTDTQVEEIEFTIDNDTLPLVFEDSLDELIEVNEEVMHVDNFSGGRRVKDASIVDDVLTFRFESHTALSAESCSLQYEGFEVHFTPFENTIEGVSFSVSVE